MLTDHTDFKEDTEKAENREDEYIVDALGMTAKFHGLGSDEQNIACAALFVSAQRVIDHPTHKIHRGRASTVSAVAEKAI